MAVRLSERKDSNLKYIQLAQQLCQHSFKLCNNEKHFPEPILANMIKQENLSILCNIRYAFSTYTLNKSNKTKLNQYQFEALAHIDALYALLELTYNDKTYNIESKSMEYWIGLVVKLEEAIRAISIC